MRAELYTTNPYTREVIDPPPSAYYDHDSDSWESESYDEWVAAGKPPMTPRTVHDVRNLLLGPSEFAPTEKPVIVTEVTRVRITARNSQTIVDANVTLGEELNVTVGMVALHGLVIGDESVIAVSAMLPLHKAAGQRLTISVTITCSRDLTLGVS